MSKAGAPARYSVPFFFSINYDADVTPLPERSVGRNLFQPMKAGQYILERLKASKFATWPKYGRITKGHIGIQGDHEGPLAIRNMRIRTLP